MSQRNDVTAADTSSSPPDDASPFFGLWGWGVSLVVVAVMVTWVWRSWTPADWLAEDLRKRLEEAPEAEVATRAAQLAELGDAAIDPLVDALGSPRQAVSEAARRELGNQLDAWELLPAAESTLKIAKLVHSLRERAPKLPPGPLRLAAELAHRALRWRLDNQSPAAMEIVSGCEIVLRTSSKANRPTAPPVSLAVFAGDSAAENPREAAWSGVPEAELLRQANFTDPQHPPSADLPLDVFPLPAPPPWPATETNPRPAQPPRDARAMESIPAGEPALLAPLPGKPVPLDETPRELRSSDAIPNQSRAAHPNAEFSRLLAVMKELHATDLPSSKQAEAELRRAGFDDLRIELARRITHPDPATRREIAEHLPKIGGLDARPWLLALLNDGDPSVSAAASRILATSSDPELQAAARDGTRR